MESNTYNLALILVLIRQIVRFLVASGFKNYLASNDSAYYFNACFQLIPACEIMVLHLRITPRQPSSEAIAVKLMPTIVLLYLMDVNYGVPHHHCLLKVTMLKIWLQLIREYYLYYY